MRCPKCGFGMEQVRCETVELDRCVRCGGLWFDKDELAALEARPGSERLDTGNARTGHEFDWLRDYDCPRCGLPMRKETFLGRGGLRCEGCPACGGRFLDAGEFRADKEATLLERIRTLLMMGRV